MLGTGVGFAQSRPARSPRKSAPAPARVPAVQKWPIESLRVEGNRRYSPEQVLRVAALKPGELAGKSEFEAARDRLLATGAFETVGYRFAPGPNGQGYVASFQIVEAEPAYPVKFEDLGIPDAELALALSAADPLFSATALPTTTIVLDRTRAALEQALAAHGQPGKVLVRVKPLAGGQPAVVFRPDRPAPTVAEVRFEGNSVLPGLALRTAVAGPAIGSPYTEESFREILSVSVRKAYDARGRLRAKFPSLRTEPVTAAIGVRVVVTVEEGEVYQFGGISITGESTLPTATLLKAAGCKSGETASYDRLEEGLDRIRQLLRRGGYLQPSVTTTRTIDDAKKTVDIAIAVAQGALYVMGKLDIAGLDLNATAEIQRIWKLKPGQPFNPAYPEAFLNSVRAQGMFDNLGNTTAKTTEHAEAHTVDVALTFSGAGPLQKKPPQEDDSLD